MALVKLTDARKSVLEGLISSLGKKSSGGQRAQVILLSAAGSDLTTVSQKAGMNVNQVRGALRSWQEAERHLVVAERRGKRELQAAIRELLDRESDGCCCGCEDQDDEFGLDKEELNTLANKVFELMNYELRVERERLGTILRFYLYHLLRQGS